MNRIIYNILAEKIAENSPFPLLSYSGIDYLIRNNAIYPICKTYYKKIDDVVTKFEPDLCSDEYFFVRPEIEESAISFIEDIDYKLVQSNKHFSRWKGTFYLVLWYNLKKLGYNNEFLISESFRRALINHFESPIGIHGGKLKFLRARSLTYNPFKKFNYNEDEKKLIIHPYASRTFQMEWSAYVSERCNINLTINEETC